MKTFSIVIATAILGIGLAGSMTQALPGTLVSYFTALSGPAAQSDVNATKSPVSHKPVMLALHCYNDANPDCW